MQDMNAGMELNPEVLIQVLQNKLAQSAIREAQMESAIQQLMVDKQELSAQIPQEEEVKEDASTN